MAGHPDHLVSMIGVSDMIIIHTPITTMICPKSEAQRVKELVGKVNRQLALAEKAQEAMLGVLNAATVADLAVQAASPRVQLTVASH